jgi:hypothetical protein
VSQPLDNPTVAELTAADIDRVDAFCAGCGHMWAAPIDFLPPATDLRKVAALIICPICRGRDIEVDPSLINPGHRIQ